MLQLQLLRNTETSKVSVDPKASGIRTRPTTCSGIALALLRGFDCFTSAWVVSYGYPSGGRNALLKHVNRIGRIGRGDQTGTALTLLEEPELRFSRDLLAIAKANGHPVSDCICLPW